MTRIERSALVPFSCEQMYGLVHKVEDYPQFMPGCASAEVLKDDGNVLEARLDLAMMGLKQSFATRNQCDPPNAMSMSLLEGPFKRLDGEWSFQALGDDACKVLFWLEFEVSNPLLALTLPKVMEQVASKQVDAVCKRARNLFG